MELLSSGIRKGGIGRGGGKRGHKKGQLEELEKGASLLFPSSLLFCPEDRDSKFLRKLVHFLKVQNKYFIILIDSSR
jgi:hypothetical protein